jgi:hypothetical protein
MPDYAYIKKGNVVSYNGKLREYYNSLAEVLEIDTVHVSNSYILKVKNSTGESKEIRAYFDEVWPITLEVGHLEKLGFKKDENRNVFRKGVITIIRPFFIKEHPEGGLIYDDKGFVVVEGELPYPFTEKQIADATRRVTSLNALQNYFSDKLNEPLICDHFI